MAYKEKPAGFAIFKLFEQYIGELARPCEICEAKIVLHQFEQCIEQESIIVEVRIKVRLAVLVCCQQPAVAP